KNTFIKRITTSTNRTPTYNYKKKSNCPSILIKFNPTDRSALSNSQPIKNPKRSQTETKEILNNRVVEVLLKTW
ncbi:hypothetical protein AAHH79_40640, partial [Burkholderia pseudomallei]